MKNRQLRNCLQPIGNGNGRLVARRRVGDLHGDATRPGSYLNLVVAHTVAPRLNGTLAKLRSNEAAAELRQYLLVEVSRERSQRVLGRRGRRRRRVGDGILRLGRTQKPGVIEGVAASKSRIFRFVYKVLRLNHMTGQ